MKIIVDLNAVAAKIGKELVRKHGLTPQEASEVVGTTVRNILREYEDPAPLFYLEDTTHHHPPET